MYTVLQCTIIYCFIPRILSHVYVVQCTNDVLYYAQDQPSRVGSFSGGPADMQGGTIFFMVPPAKSAESKGASTLAGSPLTCPPPTLRGCPGYL